MTDRAGANAHLAAAHLASWGERLDAPLVGRRGDRVPVELLQPGDELHGAGGSRQDQGPPPRLRGIPCREQQERKLRGVIDVGVADEDEIEVVGMNTQLQQAPDRSGTAVDEDAFPRGVELVARRLAAQRGDESAGSEYVQVHGGKPQREGASSAARATITYASCSDKERSLVSPLT